MVSTKADLRSTLTSPKPESKVQKKTGFKKLTYLYQLLKQKKTMDAGLQQVQVK